MQLLKKQFPKIGEWIDSLEPLIVLRGEENVVIKFSGNRTALTFTYDELKHMEEHGIDDNLLQQKKEE